MIIPTGANDTRMTTNKRQTLVDFLSYSLCEGQGKAGAYGYSPLPLNLVQAGFDQVAKLGAADPGVNIVGRDATTCDNPTFLAGDPSRNYLAEIAPQPASCDALGAGPCGSPISPPGDLALALKVPSDGLGGLVLHGPRSLALVAARDVSSVHATADLSALSVEDTRDDGSLGTWQVNVQATAFTGSPGVVDARYLGWRPALPALVPGTAACWLWRRVRRWSRRTPTRAAKVWAAVDCSRGRSYLAEERRRSPQRWISSRRRPLRPARIRPRSRSPSSPPDRSYRLLTRARSADIRAIRVIPSGSCPLRPKPHSCDSWDWCDRCSLMRFSQVASPEAVAVVAL